MEFNKIYPFKYAPKGIILNQNDKFVTTCIAETGEFSEQEVDIFRDILTQDDMVIEVGANMGAHTLALASLCKVVVAFEPQRLMFQTLAGNLALNSVDNVLAIPHAVGDKDDSILIPTLDPTQVNNFGGLSVKGLDKGEPVQQVTIDGFGFTRVDLIKLDCEGMEADVLQGARETIKCCQPWIYMEFETNRQVLLNLLEEMGYRALRHLPSHTQENNYLGVPTNNKYGSDMLLCMPPMRGPRPGLKPPFGRKHQMFKPTPEDMLGKESIIEIWEPYAG